MQPKSAIDIDISKDTSRIARNFMKIQFNDRYFGSDEQVANSPCKKYVNDCHFWFYNRRNLYSFALYAPFFFFDLACRAESQKTVARKRDVTC